MIDGYVKIDKSILNPKYKYIIINEKGGCMDSYLSPTKIKDGAKMLIHKIDKSDLSKNIGSIVCVSINGQLYTKHLINVFGTGIMIRQYAPKHTFIVPMQNISDVFVFDYIVTSGYIATHKA
jgi:hypothetical protein